MIADSKSASALSQTSSEPTLVSGLVDNLISKESNEKSISNDPKGRLISWSPWPPANFQTRYPAFPFVLTILIIVIGQWYLSLLR